MRPNLPKFEYLKTAERLQELIYSEQFDVQFLNVLDDNTVQCQFTTIDESDAQDCRSNVVIASFCTAFTRIVLYEALDLIGADRLLYCGTINKVIPHLAATQFSIISDTDSVVYVDVPGRPNVPCGALLGQFQNELKTGEFITYWACCGPKSYAYRTNSNKKVFKVKGLTINSSNKDIFQLENLQKMVVDRNLQYNILSPFKIIRVKGEFELLSKSQVKTFRFTFDKREVLSDRASTIPFGFCQ